MTRDAALLLALVACSGHESVAPPAPSDVLSPACDDAGPLAFYPPPEPLLSSARWARDQWNAVTRPDRQIRLTPLGHQRIVLWPPAGPGLIGQWSGSEVGVMFILPGIEPQRRVVLHEMGHALGLDHVPYPDSVMCGHPERAEVQPAPFPNCAPIPDKFTDHDLEEAVRVGARDP